MRRPVLPGDVCSAARALLAVPEQDRDDLCQTLFDGAGIALSYSLESGRIHSIWGDGTLSAAARRYPLADEPALDDPQYLRCMIRILMALMQRQDQPPASAET